LQHPFFVADHFAGKEDAGEGDFLHLGRRPIGMKKLIVMKMSLAADALDLFAGNADHLLSISACQAYDYLRVIDEHEAFGEIFEKGIETPPKFGQFFEELLLGLILVVHTETAYTLHCRNPPISQNAAVLKRYAGMASEIETMRISTDCWAKPSSILKIVRKVDGQGFSHYNAKLHPSWASCVAVTIPIEKE
jgi:hypothetical protein